MALRIPFFKKRPTVAVIRLQGAIGSSLRGNMLSDTGLAPIIEKAFRRGKPDAVALAINSPGGSPTQSALIAARIRRLAEKHSVPVFAFVEDVAASGGYWLATAGDEIWVDRNSIIGSIGVISSGFGFHELIGRHGVERRVHTAGSSKSLLDPFKPEQPDDVARLNTVLEHIHANFIEQVRGRRGDKLDKATDLFDGSFWVGRMGVDLGLADGVGHLIPMMQARFGDKVRFRQYGPKRSMFRLFGAGFAHDLIDVIEERAAFARFGG